MNWINIKDQLPPDGTECIVWCKTYYFVKVKFETEFKHKKNRFVEYGELYGTDFTDDVTHWMIPTEPE